MFPADVAAPEDDAAVRGRRVQRHEDTPAGMKAYAAAMDAVVEGVLSDGGGAVRRASRRVQDNAQTKLPYPPRSYRSEDNTSELQSLLRTSYAALCFEKT